MTIQQLATDIQQADGLILIVTGAGISLASGIPTFRGTDPGAVWKKDVTELGTVRYFYDEPEGSWSWYLHRFSSLIGKKPNPGHTAISELETWCEEKSKPFLLITQNIDGLHLDAGSRNVVEVHGAARKVRCSRFNCVYGAPSGSIERTEIEEAQAKFLANPTRDNVPKCPECDSYLRQHVLWFDEFYNGHDDYQWNKTLLASEEAKLILFVGTSFSVGVTELMLRAGRKNRVPIYNVDPAGEEIRGVTRIAEGSEKALPALIDSLPKIARD